MKSFVYKTWIFLILVLSASCSSSYRLTIETQEPAKITFPGAIRNLLIINNTIPQPSDVGFELSVDGVNREVTEQFPIDTAQWRSLAVLAKTIREANYFDEVLLGLNPIRSGENWLEIVPLTESVRDSLYADSGTDAILSVDRILFKTDQKVTKKLSEYFNNPLYTFVNSRVEAKLYCSIYLAGKEKALTSFSVQDSLFFYETVSSDSSLIYRWIPSMMFMEIAGNVGELTGQYFVPGWKTADRLIFTGSNARMKEASSLSRHNKWEDARAIWEKRYNEQNHPQDKARLANNIAVSWEMQDQLDTALLWAKKSKNHYFQLNPADIEEEILRIEQYINALEKRISENQLLNIQLGDPE